MMMLLYWPFEVFQKLGKRCIRLFVKLFDLLPNILPVSQCLGARPIKRFPIHSARFRQGQRSSHHNFMKFNQAKQYGTHPLPHIFVSQAFFPHRFAAAFAAICERLRGLSAAALAAPPLSPPNRPRATAAGFFFFASGGVVLGASPMDSRKIRWASSFGSRGRVFERSGMMLSVSQASAGCQ